MERDKRGPSWQIRAMANEPSAKLLVASYLSLLERAESVPGLLSSAEQPDARRLVSLCRQFDVETLATPRTPVAPATGPDLALRQEIGRLVEYLGRRQAAGIPLATLGRATLAGLAGSQRDFARACEETNQNLLMLGL